MKQQLFILSNESLADINALLAQGYNIGNQYHISGGSIVFVVLYKYETISSNGISPINYYPTPDW